MKSPAFIAPGDEFVSQRRGDRAPRRCVCPVSAGPWDQRARARHHHDLPVRQLRGKIGRCSGARRPEAMTKRTPASCKRRTAAVFAGLMFLCGPSRVPSRSQADETVRGIHCAVGRRHRLHIHHRGIRGTRFTWMTISVLRAKSRWQRFGEPAYAGCPARIVTLTMLTRHRRIPRFN